MKSILNNVNVDYTQQPLFLGEGLGIQRYDRFKYPLFMDLFNKQRFMYWSPEELNLSKDRGDFLDLTDNEKHIFTSNLQFQTMLDSVIQRGVPSLLKHVSNPELEACLNVWGFFEQIHSYSYTYIIKNVYADPGKVFDTILENKEILERAKSAKEAYDDLRGCDEKDLKKQIYMTLVSINILEGVRFYVSFVCSFIFGENKKMCGNADVIKLIHRDEQFHVKNTCAIVKILKENADEGFQKTIKECEEDVYRMFEEAANEEKRWAEYLFQNGSLLGLNEKILKEYVEWLVDTRLRGLGYKNIFNTKNPIKGWINNWMSSSNIQVAPQETEIINYQKGAVDNNLSSSNFTL